MDDRRVGKLLRTVRQHLEMRQLDVALRAGVSQGIVSGLELGRLETIGLAKMRRVAAVLGVSISIDAWWRGGQADRLMDRAHAAIVEQVIGLLTAAGWQVVPEFTFNHYGDRGSVDILAWRPDEQILLIVEVKATLTDLQDLLGALSRKVRVVPGVVSAQLGWRPRHLARLVIVAGTKGNRSIVQRHAATFDAAFPARSREARGWIRRPTGSIAALWFVSTSSEAAVRRTSRVRVRPSVRGGG